MSCNGLGVILDASVFICWCDNETGYGQIVETIIQDNLYLVVCEQLQKEYLRQLNRRYVGASNQVLRRKLEQLEFWGILRNAMPNSQEEIKIHRKDQHVLNCALNNEYFAHIIVSENQAHFVSTTIDYILPVIISKDAFLNPNDRQSACGDAKRVVRNIRKIGRKAMMKE